MEAGGREREAHAICLTSMAPNQPSLPNPLNPSWVEHDPDEIVATVTQCAEGALAAASAAGTPARVVAVGLTNQRETVVAWDTATGRPLHHAIVWNDGRTAGVCRGVEAAHGGRDAFRATTGLPVSPYFSAYKIVWLLKHVPAVADAAAAGTLTFGTIDAWLVWSLTGGVAGGTRATDVTNASRTGLLDVGACEWHAPTAASLGVDTAWLPRVLPSAADFGTIVGGPLAGAPITGVLGDQQAAVVGQRCVPGDAKATYGTGAFVLAVTEGEAPVASSAGLLTTVAYKLGADAPTRYALEGAVAVAGAGVTWLRDGLGMIDTPADAEALARTVPDSAGVVFVPAFSGLLAPHWRPDARGVLLGITAATTKAHVCRAVLDAIAWQTRDVLTAAAADGAPVRGALRVDGGASASDLLMQIQADVARVRVVRPANGETTSLGAALAAGVGVGLWSAEDAMTVGLDTDGSTVFDPGEDEAGIEAAAVKWRLAVERSLGLDILTGGETE